jgi:pilus assembly protein Flp/PilA
MKDNTMKILKKLLSDESGATAIEYGLIAALISVVIIVAVTFLGAELEGTFEQIGETLAARPEPGAE